MKGEKAFVTGVEGQDGTYLSKFLLEKGYEVFGLVYKKNRDYLENLEHLGVDKRIEIIKGDIRDQDDLNSLIRKIRPDEVYNLAAQSFVGTSWEQAKMTTEINAIGTLNILNAIKNYAPFSRFYQASTSEMFGTEKGIKNENASFHPRNPYAVSKVYAHFMTVNYRESYGLFACSGISFNHESPLRGREFVTRKIADGVARIKLGLSNEIRLGSLSSRRDWGFAGDFVEAMWLMLHEKKPDDYIICTGKTHSIRDFLALAFKSAGITNWGRYIHIDPRFKRPSEPSVLQGSSDKAKRVLGWKPKVSFPELVKMMVEADIERLRRESGKKPAHKQSTKNEKANSHTNL